MDRFPALQTQDSRMDATLVTDPASASEDYKSRPGALVWFFRKSRDGWKRKHQELKASVKAYKNQIAAVTKSREQWRVKAERTGEQLTALEAENARLRTLVASLDEKKNGPGGWSAESHAG
jgi:hypothetical protein